MAVAVEDCSWVQNEAWGVNLACDDGIRLEFNAALGMD